VNRFATILALLSVIAPVARADEVTVRETALTLPYWTSEPNWKANPHKNSAFHAQRDSIKRDGERTFKVIVLENKYLEVHVLPGVGGVIHRAIYKPTGEDIFFREMQAKDVLPWWESGVKASFPFREHGIRVDQPAAYRIVRRDDGSIAIGMWMSFFRFNDYVNRWQWGRFSSMELMQTVWLNPDENLLHVRYTVYNPMPFKQGKQIWNDALFPRHHTKDGVVHGKQKPPKTTDTELILPSKWVSDHNGKTFRKITPEEKRPANYKKHGTSIFAWDVTQPFAGLYYPQVDVNRLRIADPKTAPGTKFFFQKEGLWKADNDSYSAHSGNYIELWGGDNHVFEGIEDWLGPGETFDVEHAFTFVKGIGKVDFANEQVAFSVDTSGTQHRIHLATTTKRSVTMRVPRGLREEPFETTRSVSPTEPVIVTLPEGVAATSVEIADGDERLVYWVRVKIADPKEPPYFDTIRRALRTDLPENHEKHGIPMAWGRSILNANYKDDPLAAGRVAYRLGQLQRVEALLTPITGEHAEAWTLLAHLRYEQSDGRKRKETREMFHDVQFLPGGGRPYELAVLTDDMDERLRLLEGKPDPKFRMRGKVKFSGQMHKPRQDRLLIALLAVRTMKKVDDDQLRELQHWVADEPASPRVLLIYRTALQTAGKTDEAAAVSAELEAMKKTEPGLAETLDRFRMTAEGKLPPPHRWDSTPPKKP